MPGDQHHNYFSDNNKNIRQGMLGDIFGSDMPHTMQYFLKDLNILKLSSIDQKLVKIFYELQRYYCCNVWM